MDRKSAIQLAQQAIKQKNRQLIEQVLAIKGEREAQATASVADTAPSSSGSAPVAAYTPCAGRRKASSAAEPSFAVASFVADTSSAAERASGCFAAASRQRCRECLGRSAAEEA